ncbi:hypothetical protein PsorP6_017020 [Peronosclerospora sorghi]|uniref:Uncharacterized protein n=1 Tax=Peronosclerospora sorghi TaxID=230839 RepID=A0ACC0WET2_9STRA|nr:hypothetical protein PsorP6_017020 [Peronosclerospora sorghi]
MSDSVDLENIKMVVECDLMNENGKAVALNGKVVSKSGIMNCGKILNDSRRAVRWDEKEVTWRVIHKATSAALATEGLKSQLGHAKADLANLRSKRPKIQASINYANKCIVEVIDPEMHKFNAALKSRESKITALREQINAVEDGMFADISEAVSVENIRVYQ